MCCGVDVCAFLYCSGAVHTAVTASASDALWYAEGVAVGAYVPSLAVPLFYKGFKATPLAPTLVSPCTSCITLHLLGIIAGSSAVC